MTEDELKQKFAAHDNAIVLWKGKDAFVFIFDPDSNTVTSLALEYVPALRSGLSHTHKMNVEKMSLVEFLSDPYADALTQDADLRPLHAVVNNPSVIDKLRKDTDNKQLQTALLLEVYFADFIADIRKEHPVPEGASEHYICIGYPTEAQERNKTSERARVGGDIGRTTPIYDMGYVYILDKDNAIFRAQLSSKGDVTSEIYYDPAAEEVAERFHKDSGIGPEGTGMTHVLGTANSEELLGNLLGDTYRARVAAVTDEFGKVIYGGRIAFADTPSELRGR